MRRGTAGDLEGLLRFLALAGAATLIAALVALGVGTATRTILPDYGRSLPFLLAVLVVTAPYADLIERRPARRRRVPTDERLGFAPNNHPWPKRAA